MKDNFKGQVTAVFKDISIPDNPERYDYIRLLFIPIEVVAQINTLFGNINLPMFFNDLIEYSRDIFSRMQNLDLVYGNLYLVAENGKIYFRRCAFKGDGNPITKFKFDGFIDFDKKIDMNSEVKLDNFFVIPLHISGDISNPTPNYLNLIIFIEDEVSSSAEKGIIDVMKLLLKKHCIIQMFSSKALLLKSKIIRRRSKNYAPTSKSNI